MSVVKKPLITEKTTKMGEKLGQYAFVVDKKAKKPEIIAELQKLYNVEITAISTMLYMGKRKTRFTKAGVIAGKKPNFKKAVIKLKEGQSIDFFESI
jgi:large subunit ribosomal protein L23